LNPSQYYAIKYYYENVTDEELNRSLNRLVEQKKEVAAKLDFIRMELQKRHKNDIEEQM